MDVIDDDDVVPAITPEPQVEKIALANDIAPRHGDIQGLELRGIAKNEKA